MRTIVDDQPSLTTEQFEKIRNVYWVCTSKGDTARPYAWVFSLTKPQPVPNPTMDWRHPTYSEAIERQRWFEQRRDDYEKWAQEYCRNRRHHMKPYIRMERR